MNDNKGQMGRKGRENLNNCLYLAHYNNIADVCVSILNYPNNLWGGPELKVSKGTDWFKPELSKGWGWFTKHSFLCFQIHQNVYN